MSPRFSSDKSWALTALALFPPTTAILHHRVFYPPTCILNPFGSPDYTWSAIVTWVKADPSPTLALLIALTVFVVGGYVRSLRRPVLALAIAFMPLAIWIWDIPGSGRFICHHFHDGRAGLHTRHFFLLGLVLWPCTIVWLKRRITVRLRSSAATL